jgi:exopolysaccharide biosynthesis protein
MDGDTGSRKRKRKIKRVVKCVLLSIAGLFGAVVAAFFFMLYGPFHQLRDYYVITMLETSAAKFMATAFFSDKKIAEILANNRLIVPDENTNPSLVSIVVPQSTAADGTEPPETEGTGQAVQTTAAAEPQRPRETTVTTLNPMQTIASAPDELFKDDPNAMHETDGLDGLQLVKVSGSTFTGYMLVISDPSRVRLCVSQSILYAANSGLPWDKAYGEKLASMASRSGALAAINGGAFYDPEGKGNGGQPKGALCYDGKLLYWGPEEEAKAAYAAAVADIDARIDSGELDPSSPEAVYPELADTSTTKVNIIGINRDNILILGRFTKEEFLKQGFRDAVSFDNPDPPFLVINGEASKIVGTGGSGIQPRTCIGQRADGAFLFLVIDGRGAGGSLGATQKDAMDLLIRFGAVNAANLDGGSSSEMIINGVTVSNPCSLYGPRYLPDGFIVK